MLYEFAHFLRRHASFVWNVAERANSVLFAFEHRKALKELSSLVNHFSKDDFFIRRAVIDDAPAMAKFFEAEPKETFKYFRPHQFDENSLRKVLCCSSFLAFLVMKENDIVGYFFLRCFANGKCFKGYMVNSRFRGNHVATLEGLVMNKVAELLNLHMFGSISPENKASMAAAKAVNDMKLLKTLENGDLYFEFLPKGNS